MQKLHNTTTKEVKNNMTKFNINNIKNEGKEIRAFIKKNKYYPRYATIKDTNGKEHKLKPSQYNGLFESTNVYWIKNGRLPNYVTLNATANNPLVMDYQNNKYTCCPTSLSMAIQMLYGFKSENECKKACKTVERDNIGTSPANLISGAKSLGYSCTPISRKFSSVTASLQSCKPLIAHCQTRGLRYTDGTGYQNDYGHYILIWGTKSGNQYKVADPTKGLKTINAKVLNSATGGRDIKYYAIGVA